MLQLKNLSKAFGKNVVLDNVSLNVNTGEILGLVAPNGTGKTTLLNIIMNFLNPDEGQVSYDKLDYSSKKKEIKMRQHIAFLPEIDDLYQELTGLEHINYYARLWKGSTKEVSDIIDRLGMNHYVKNPVRTYSLGMRQRLCFAMIRAADTPVMLMDEVMNGLDPDNVKLLTGELIQLKEQGKMILIASHLLDNLDLYADKVLFLKDGTFTLETLDLLEDYIKVKMTEEVYRSLQKEKTFPDGTQFIAKHLLCVPVKGMAPDTLGEWTSYFYKKGLSELTIGKIGSSEWYKEYYTQSE